MYSNFTIFIWKRAVNGANLFISESLEIDKFKYYQLLNNTRVEINLEDEKSIKKAKSHYTNRVKFFLEAYIRELDKLINKIDKINELYEIISWKANNNTDGKSRVKTYYFYELIDILR